MTSTTRTRSPTWRSACARSACSTRCSARGSWRGTTLPSRGTCSSWTSARPRRLSEYKEVHVRERNRLVRIQPLGYNLGMSESASLLKEARRQAGITQAELARRLGISQAAVAKLERPGANPTPDTLDGALWAP